MATTGSFWDFLPAIITAGATIYGAKQASKTTNQATQQLTQAQQAGTQAELAAIEAAKTQYQTLQRQASPGLVALQGVVGRGDALTPAQTQAIEDARRTSLDALSGSGLRGSAGATVATVRDVEGRMRGDFMQQNQSRADQAAANLSGQYFNQGANQANMNLTGGAALSSGLTSTGNIAASNTIGQGRISGSAIGDIGAVIADQIKQNNRRDSSYQTPGGRA